MIEMYRYTNCFGSALWRRRSHALCRHRCRQGLILNGGFESGLSNWYSDRSIGQRRNILRTDGHITPDYECRRFQPPPEGSASGNDGRSGTRKPCAVPGLRLFQVLYQELLINFMLLLNNQGDRFAIPEPDNHLDFSTTGTQSAGTRGHHEGHFRSVQPQRFGCSS